MRRTAASVLALLLSGAPALAAGAARGPARPASPPASVSLAGGLPLSPLSASLTPALTPAAAGWGREMSALLLRHDAVLVGESHNSLSSLRTLAAELPRLAAAGVGVVGLEGLKAPQQPAVDAWLDGKRPDLPEEALAFSPKRREALLQLFSAAKAHGVRVAALGEPLETWAGQVERLVAERGVELDARLPDDFKEQVALAADGYHPGYNEIVAEVALERRNRSMAARLRGAMPPGVKAVAVVGSAHVAGPDDFAASLYRVRGRYGHLGGELGRLGVSAFSLTFAGGEFVGAAAASDDERVRPRAYRASAGLDGAGLTALASDSGVWFDGAPSGRSPLH